MRCKDRTAAAKKSAPAAPTVASTPTAVPTVALAAPAAPTVASAAGDHAPQEPTIAGAAATAPMASSSVATSNCESAPAFPAAVAATCYYVLNHSSSCTCCPVINTANQNKRECPPAAAGSTNSTITPAKKPKKRESAFQKSPTPLAECDHGAIANYYRFDDCKYFTKKYLERDNWARACAGTECPNKNKFGPKPAYRVGPKKPVHLCYNAKNTEHPCVHAYCEDCFQKFSKECDDKMMAAARNTSGGQEQATGQRRTRRNRRGA